MSIASGPPRFRSNDTRYDFRPNSDFVYLVGDREPDSVLVLWPVSDGHDAVLYRDNGRFKPDTPLMFADRSGEMWTGPRLSRAEAESEFGIECADLADLVTHERSRLAKSAAPDDVANAVAELRLCKDEGEIGAIRAAVKSTVQGFDDVAARALAADVPSERLVDAVFGMRARLDGNGVGFLTIAGSGPNATVLHWNRNDRTMAPGDLLLLDAGVETHDFYTADVTRTMPVGGCFSAAQRSVYEIVLAAQDAAIAECRPGREFRDYHLAADRVLAEGLRDLGVLPVPADRSLEPDQQHHRRWTIHGAGHMLGLDLHDCAAGRRDPYWNGKLRSGHVLTVEPGLYFQPDDGLVPPELRGIGVRIEDDILITAAGPAMLSAELPRSPADIEAWLAGHLSPCRQK